jgi:hypothetical protein
MFYQVRSEDYFEAPPALAVCFRRSAHRRFIASAILLRPSGLILFRGAAAAADAFAFLLPLGRPGPFAVFVEMPESNSRARCSLDISESISAMIRLTSIV